MSQLRGESASSRAYTWTRLRIFDGTFSSGEMISEGEISQSLGLSRTPVREAFLLLASEGILDLFPKRGAFVVPITPADMRNVMEARLLIEPWAASVAASLDDRKPLVSVLQSRIRELLAARLPADALRYQEADRAFHEAIVAATDNSLVEAFYRSLRDRQLRMGAVAAGTTTGRAETIHVEHQVIIDAIASGDAEQAAASVRTHIASTRAALEPRLRVT